MIELVYFDQNAIDKAYQVIQLRSGESWRVARDGELLGSLEKLDGVWYGRGRSELAAHLVQHIGELIDAQHFNQLPGDIKTHWPGQVQAVIATGDAEYMVVARPQIDFERFAKVFSAYIPHLLKDEWPILFKLYNAEMTEDIQLTAQGMKR
jgi:hypothetical protein